jgi:hypothetical protein
MIENKFKKRLTFQNGYCIHFTLSTVLRNLIDLHLRRNSEDWGRDYDSSGR